MISNENVSMSKQILPDSSVRDTRRTVRRKCTLVLRLQSLKDGDSAESALDLGNVRPNGGLERYTT